MEIPLVKGEKVVSEYYFKDHLDHKNKCILTNRRLIVGYKDTVEQYPLSKITGTKVIIIRYTFLYWIAAVFLAGALIISSGEEWALTEEAKIMRGVLFALAAVCAYFGSKKGRFLEINQMGGTKRYGVRFSDPQLEHFINEVNATLL